MSSLGSSSLGEVTIRDYGDVWGFPSRKDIVCPLSPYSCPQVTLFNKYWQIVVGVLLGSGMVVTMQKFDSLFLSMRGEIIGEVAIRKLAYANELLWRDFSITWLAELASLHWRSSRQQGKCTHHG